MFEQQTTVDEFGQVVENPAYEEAQSKLPDITNPNLFSSSQSNFDINQAVQYAMEAAGLNSLAETLNVSVAPAPEIKTPETPKGVDAAVKDKDKEESLLDSIEKRWDKFNEYAKKNKDNPVLMAGLAGMASALKDSQAKDNASRAQQFALEQMDRKAQIERDQNAAYSASVMGIPKAKGIIGRQQLKRRNGTNVFKPNGTIA